MLALLALVVSVALVDSLDPATLAVALYLATLDHPRRRVAEFAVTFFAVNVLAGVLFVLGPGQLVIELVPKPSATARHVVALVGGVALILLGIIALVKRDRMRRLLSPEMTDTTRSSWWVGAAVAAAELPTAFPFWAVLAAIVSSHLALADQLLLVVLFDVVFVLPMMVILVVLTLLGERGKGRLAAAGDWFRHRSPAFLGGLGLLIGTALVIYGVTGLP